MQAETKAMSGSKAKVEAKANAFNCPDTSVLGEDWAVIETLLPQGWQEQARQLGAFQRAGSIADARTLLKLMFIHLAEGCSLRETAARAALAGMANISDVALLKRLRGCGNWFEWMGQQLRRSLEPAQPGMAAGPWLSGKRLLAVDGSVVSEPGATGSQWRLHYAISLPDLRSQQVHLGPASQGESLKRLEISAGDILMADRGYAHPGGIAHAHAQGAEVIVRMNLVTLPLYASQEADAPKLDLLALGSTLPCGQARSWRACIHLKDAKGRKTGEHVNGRVCLIRKSAHAAERSRQRVRRESQRNGSRVQPQTLEAAGYVMVFTTVAEEVDAAQILALYRLRWQIELTFKRLKSLLALGHLKKHDERAARSWLQGKLLLALVLDALIAQAERFSPWGYDSRGPLAAQDAQQRPAEAAPRLSVARDVADAGTVAKGIDSGAAPDRCHDAVAGAAPQAG